MQKATKAKKAKKATKQTDAKVATEQRELVRTSVTIDNNLLQQMRTIAQRNKMNYVGLRTVSEIVNFALEYALQNKIVE